MSKPAPRTVATVFVIAMTFMVTDGGYFFVLFHKLSLSLGIVGTIGGATDQIPGVPRQAGAYSGFRVLATSAPGA